MWNEINIYFLPSVEDSIRTLRFLYLLLGCPVVPDPPAVLVARLVRIISMSCSAVVCKAPSLGGY